RSSNLSLASSRSGQVPATTTKVVGGAPIRPREAMPDQPRQRGRPASSKEPAPRVRRRPHGYAPATALLTAPGGYMLAESPPARASAPSGSASRSASSGSLSSPVSASKGPCASLVTNGGDGGARSAT